jgi:hypothetical protein
MSLALPPEAIPQLRAAIAKRTGANPDTIRFAALPFPGTYLRQSCRLQLVDRRQRVAGNLLGRVAGRMLPDLTPQ